MKALIVYGTRGGATQKIADEIGKVFEEQGFAVTVVNANESKGVDAGSFDLIVVGSSVWATRWTGAATGFLKRHQKVMASKKVALFSSGLAGSDPAQTDYANKSIAEVAAKFPAIKPVALAYFGGYINFDSPNLIAKFMANAMKNDFAKKGIDTTRPVDQRDWNAIRAWAADVTAKAR